MLGLNNSQFDCTGARGRKTADRAICCVRACQFRVNSAAFRADWKSSMRNSCGRRSISCQPTGKHTRSKAPNQHCIYVWQLVSAPAQDRPLSPVSMCGNWSAYPLKSTHSARHCVHVWQLVSAPAQECPLALFAATGKHARSSAPAQHCIHAWQLVSAPTMRGNW